MKTLFLTTVLIFSLNSHSELYCPKSNDAKSKLLQKLVIDEVYKRITTEQYWDWVYSCFFGYKTHNYPAYKK